MSDSESTPKSEPPSVAGDEDTEIRKSKREVTLTDKGKHFQVQKLTSFVKTAKKRIEKQWLIIDKLLSGTNVELVNNEVVAFDKSYNDVSDAYSRLCGLYGDEMEEHEQAEHAEIAALMEKVDDEYLAWKSIICTWVLKQDEKTLQEVEKASSTSSKRSKASSSSRSSGSSQKSGKSRASVTSQRSVREEAKIAGLKAEIESLKKTKEAELTAEMSKIEQKIKIAEAMKKVYSAHENDAIKQEETTAANDEGIKNKPISKDNDSDSNKTFITKEVTDTRIGDNMVNRRSPPHMKDSTLTDTSLTPALHTNVTDNQTVDNTLNSKPPPHFQDSAPAATSLMPAVSTELHSAMIEMIKLQSAPKPDLDVFDGNPLEYLFFRANFKEVVESVVTDQRGRLTRLIKYTTGDAQELIKHLVHSETKCYDKAIELLDKEYGNAHLLSCSYIKELRLWKNIAEDDVDGFKKLYRFLLKCRSYKECNRLQELDSTDLLATIISKTHRVHQGRWNRKAVQIRQGGREAKFEDLLKFFEKETEVLNDPAYSKAALGEINAITSRATRVQRTPTIGDECPICKGSHDIEDCEEYLKLDIDNRHKTVFRNNLCFSCLSLIGDDHVAKNCSNKRMCRVCNKSHPTTLHGGNEASSFHTSVTNQSAISMCVVPVQLWHASSPDRKIVVYALIDDCCTGTFISEEALESLPTTVNETAVEVTTLNGRTVEPSSSVTGLCVQSLPSHNTSYPAPPIELPVTFSRPSLSIEKEEVPTPSKIAKWDHLRVLMDKIPDYDPSIPFGLMIGGNCSKACAPLEAIEGVDGPFAKRSRLGWCVVGPTQGSSRAAINCYHTRIIPVTDISTGMVGNHHFTVQEETKDTSITGMLKEMYANEFNETSGEKRALSHEDEKFLEIMKQGVRGADGKLELPLPFRDDNLTLPDNRLQALNRVMSLKRRLMKNEPLRVAYCDIMNELTKKYAQKADKSKDQAGKVWYAMHHAVKNKVKDKWRVVFNLAARCKGRALNDELIQGPDMTNLLVGVLLRFRKERIAFMADIEAMFYQVRVPEKQRSFLRFFWWKDGDFETEPEEFEMCVHLFGGVSSGGCANFALKKTADDFEHIFGVEAADTIRRDFYVDDWLKSVKDVMTALNLIKNVQGMCEAGGFNITKFISNNRDVISAIPSDKRASSVINLDLSSSLPIERALGV